MRYPPYETNPFEDVFDNAVSDTAQEISKDLLEMIEEKVREHAEEYFDIPVQWHDEIIDQKYDFIEEIVKEVMSKIKIK
jgi:gamma-glutamyl-gamma-aminobutyrate hydrolase PuuD